MSTRFSGIRSLVFKSGSISSSIQLGGGNPDGLVTAESGSLFIDSTDANLYINRDGADEWSRFLLDPGSSPLTFSGPVVFEGGLSGSLTHLADGTSYIKAGTNVTVVTGADGSVTISATDTDTTYDAGTGLDLTGTTFSIDDSVVATLSGSTFSGAVVFEGGLSGSLTKLADGSNYLLAGPNIVLTTGSNGAVTIQAVGDGVGVNATIPVHENNLVLWDDDNGDNIKTSGITHVASAGLIGLELSGSADDISFAIVPKGEGAVQLTLDGNARGINAVDLQIDRNSLNQVASGDFSAVLGGRENTASADLSAVVAGRANTADAIGSVIVGGISNMTDGYCSAVIAGENSLADADYSLAIGNSAVTNFTGEVAQAAGVHYNTGDAQTSKLVMLTSTIDDTLQELLIAGIDQLVLEEHCAYKFIIDVIGKRLDSVSSMWMQIQGGVVRGADANTVTLIGQPAELRSATPSAEDWDVIVGVDTATGALRLQVLGEDEVNILWTATVILTKVIAPPVG